MNLRRKLITSKQLHQNYPLEEEEEKEKERKENTHSNNHATIKIIMNRLHVCFHTRKYILRSLFVLIIIFLSEEKYGKKIVVDNNKYNKNHNKIKARPPTLMLLDDDEKIINNHRNNDDYLDRTINDRLFTDEELENRLWFDPELFNTNDKMNPKHTGMPLWIRDYWIWHHEQLLRLSKTRKYNITTVTSNKTIVDNNDSEEWKHYKYLIVRCYDNINIDVQCGGLADRLLSLPFVLLLASKTNRILFIIWTKPYPLETFLLPRKGSLQWIIPKWLYRSIVKSDDDDNNNSMNYKPTSSNVHTSVKKIVKQYLQSSNNHMDNHYKQQRVLWIRIQDYVSAWEYYDSNQSPSSFLLHYNDNNNDNVSSSISAKTSTQPTAIELYGALFHLLFIPSPILKEKIESTMRSLSLIKKQYIVAHYRALYNSRDEHEEEEQQNKLNTLHRAIIQNAINCAFHLSQSNNNINILNLSTIHKNVSNNNNVLPIYVCSDSNKILEFVQQKYNNNNNTRSPIVVVNSNINNKSQAIAKPVHIDKYIENNNNNNENQYFFCKCNIQRFSFL